MKHFSLNGTWQLIQNKQGESLLATVPGCVHTDLIANNRLDDPFYRDNEQRQMWVGETEWRYTRTFTVPPELLQHDRLILCCYGLDTLATLYINDQPIGDADNMYRTWEFDVKQVLVAGDNTLTIDFASPMQYVRKMDAEKGEMAGWVEPMRVNTGAWIRKQPSNFGWDWGPKMMTSGIWRDIELIAFNTARIEEVVISQQHGDGQVELTLALAVKAVQKTHLSATVSLKWGETTVATVEQTVHDHAEVKITVEKPALWWVAGLGDHPLYDVSVSLNDANGVLDTWEAKIGLRTLTLERHTDEWGESFYFACNGVPFFAKGANWIPISPYPGQPKRADYERFIQAAAEANMNMLRVWGGGFYEDDAFYDLCDHYGIAVWQDFIFACGTYPSFDADFMTNVEAEARDNIRRLRHHASLALLCGNNEIEQGLPTEEWKATLSWEQYSLLFDDLLANLVKELAPQISYWPASPHTPLGDREDHQNPNAGDTHLWAVWHGLQPYEWYRTRPDRFVSEFGFQSFPEPATVYEVTIPEDHNLTSYVMEHFQRSKIGNVTIIYYLVDWFRLPTAFDSLLWLSQILQAMAMKYAVEHWRRNMPRTMGTLYWQLNDMWAAPSWASVDWKGNWKALHYMAKRFYAPLLVSGVENLENGTVDVYATSDLLVDQPAKLVCTITDAVGNELEVKHVDIVASSASSHHVNTVDVSQWLAQHSPRNILVWLDLSIDNQPISDNLVTFSRPKHLQLVAPEIQFAITPLAEGEFEVQLESKAVALYVWLELPGATFSDNFFHLKANAPRKIRVRTKDIQGLAVKSLWDTYSV